MHLGLKVYQKIESLIESEGANDELEEKRADVPIRRYPGRIKRPPDGLSYK